MMPQFNLDALRRNVPTGCGPVWLLRDARKEQANRVVRGQGPCGTLFALHRTVYCGVGVYLKGGKL